MYVFCKHTLCKAHYWTHIEVFPSTDISGLQQIENICAKSENFVHRGKNPHGSRQQAASHRTAGPRWEAAYYLLLFILNSVFLFDLFTACLSLLLSLALSSRTHTHTHISRVPLPIIILLCSTSNSELWTALIWTWAQISRLSWARRISNMSTRAAQSDFGARWDTKRQTVN